MATLLFLAAAGVACPARAERPPTLLVWAEGPSAQQAAHSLGEAAAGCGRFELARGGDVLGASALPPALREQFAAGRFELSDDASAEAVRRAAGAEALLVVGPVAGSTSLRVRLYERGTGLVWTRPFSAGASADAFWARLEPAGSATESRCGRAGRPACGPAWYWAAAGVVVLGVVVAGFAIRSQDEGAWSRFPR